MVFNYRISEENTHIGMIRYSSTAEVAISLTQYLQLNRLTEEIFDIHYTGGIADLLVMGVRMQNMS